MNLDAFANHHPFIFFLILLLVVIPIIAIVVGVAGEVLQSFFAIFKRNK